MSRAANDTMERVRRAAAGDEHAFRELVREVYPTLRRWALARTGAPDDADEVVQRALIRMHRSLHAFSGEGRLTTWLYRIVANAAIDLHRSQVARSASGASPAESPDPEPADAEWRDPLQAVHAGRMAAAVRDFFETLPPRQREVLELVDHQGLRPVEVAAMLEIEPVSVRASLFKGRRAVRKAILARYPDVGLFANEVGDILETSVTIPAGHSVVLGTAKSPAYEGALILVVRADIVEPGISPSPSPDSVPAQ